MRPRKARAGARAVARRFARRVSGNLCGINAADRQQFAMLTMLDTICQQALLAFRAADNPVDGALVADLESMVARTRAEIDAIAAKNANPS